MKARNTVRGESKINLYDSHFRSRIWREDFMCYVRQIRYRMHVSDAIFKEPWNEDCYSYSYGCRYGGGCLLRPMSCQPLVN